MPTILTAAGSTEWTPRELRHSFVSLLSSSGVAIEDISHLIGHASTNVTEKVYRKELRPVLTKGARAMDGISIGGRRIWLAVWLAGSDLVRPGHHSQA